jgi:transcriptional regulator with XRE-family HTH domain
MELKDRLLKIKNSESMSSAMFADTVGVQRSSISHIMSGRNKPSLDFLQKVLTAFPKYRAEWLIMGTGSIYKKAVQNTLFEDVDTTESSSNTTINTTKDENKVPEQTNSANSTNTTDIKEDVPPNSNKKTIKIVMFYSDNTFSEYYPE